MHPHELGLSPERSFDRALLDAVRPSGWSNPVPRQRYHMVVIGGGTGGLVTAVAAASLGARVALVEHRLLGGDCLNVGCVPSKAIIRSARAWHDARSARRFGAPTVNDDALAHLPFEHMRRTRAAIAPHDSAERLRSLGVDVFLGEARFTSPQVIEVDGATLRFRRAVIATGTRPLIPPIKGLDGSGYLTNETVFGLDAAPASMAVIGGGPIGVELAQAFSRLGTRVTVIENAARIVPSETARAAAQLAEALRRDGVELLPGTSVAEVKRGADGCLLQLSGAGRRALTTDTLLVATGRAPNVERLNLGAAGIAHGKDGVVVDDRLRTTNRRVYAVGDVVGRLRFTHLADAHARIVVANALFFGRGRQSRLVVPRVTYTDPEIAHVGITPEEARGRGLAIDTVELSMASVDRAQLDDRTAGFLHVYLAAGTDRILGATLVADGAGEMIGEIALAMTAGLRLRDVGKTIHPYPTRSEIFRKAADSWRRRKLTPRVRRILGVYFRLLG